MFINQHFTPLSMENHSSTSSPKQHTCSASSIQFDKADRLQGRRDDLQGSTWNCAAIPGTAVTCRRPTWSADTALCQYQSSSGATSQTVNCWWPGLQCRWSSYLEPVAGGDHVSTVFVDVLSASQDIPLREIIS